MSIFFRIGSDDVPGKVASRANQRGQDPLDALEEYAQEIAREEPSIEEGNEGKAVALALAEYYKSSQSFADSMDDHPNKREDGSFDLREHTK